MKDRSRELRRVGRGRYLTRVHRGNKARLSELPEGEGRAMRGREAARPGPKTSSRRADGACTNWRVTRYGSGEIVAIEPNRDYEHTFEGGEDPYWEAVQYAAEQLRKGA